MAGLIVAEKVSNFARDTSKQHTARGETLTSRDVNRKAEFPFIRKVIWLDWLASPLAQRLRK